MYLRFAAVFAVLAIGLTGQSERAAAQGYPYIRDRGGYVPVPSPYDVPDVEGEEESVVMTPENRSGLPYPPQADRHVPSAPGFIYPERDANVSPYGQAPSGDPSIQRSELPPPGLNPADNYFAPRPQGDANMPRPPAGISPNQQATPGQQPYPYSQQPADPSVVSSLPPEDQPEVGEVKELPQHLKRQFVEFRTKEPAGTIVIDTAKTYLYLVLGQGQAIRYGIGVGREGFTWSGVERVSRMAEWPDWHPPEEMIQRQPYLPRFMAGGESNPLGARALYLGKTLYRIHGTNQPSTIGSFVSSGCVRLLNEDIQDLYERVKVGTRVVVLPGKAPATAQSQPPATVRALPPTTAQAQPAQPTRTR